MSASQPPVLNKEGADGALDPHDETKGSSDVTHPSEEPLTGLAAFYRSTLFQILVVGLCAFSTPGIWVAMMGLGVGGSASPQLMNSVTATAYALMTLTCFLGPWITNIIGFRYTLALGTVGYPLYAAALYANNRYGNVWFVYLGGVLCGTSAGFFWSVEGAISTGYPEAHKRGRYLATWFTFRNAGSIVGGSIALAINHKANHAGAVSYKTYQAFIAIQCLGVPIGLLLSNPENVRRDDGTRIEAPRGIHPLVQAKEMWRLLKSPPILLLAPLFWYFGWIQAYPGTYLAVYFTVRSRALASLLFAVVMSLSTWASGSIVDLKWSKNRKTRALVAFGLVVVLNSITWIWSVIIQDEYRKTSPVLDWSDPGFGRGFGAYMFQCIAQGIVENFIYWSISNLSDSPGDQIRYSSLLRGIETAAVAVGFGVQAVPTKLVITAGINLTWWFIALPFAYFATITVVKKFEADDKKSKEVEA